jgi:hypothetical protein
MNDVQVPEKVNNTCEKTFQMGMMNRAFQFTSCLPLTAVVLHCLFYELNGCQKKQTNEQWWT